MLRVDAASERAITLLHVDERPGSPGRYCGFATGPIVGWLASAICTRFKNSGIAVDSTRPREEAMEGWHSYESARAPVYSFYRSSGARTMFVPACKEHLDLVVQASYPDLNATLTVFREYRSLFGADELQLQEHIENHALCTIGAEAGIFSIQGLRTDIDFHELMLGIVSEINQYLN